MVCGQFGSMIATRSAGFYSEQIEGIGQSENLVPEGTIGELGSKKFGGDDVGRVDGVFLHEKRQTIVRNTLSYEELVDRSSYTRPGPSPPPRYPNAGLLHSSRLTCFSHTAVAHIPSGRPKTHEKRLFGAETRRTQRICCCWFFSALSASLRCVFISPSRRRISA